MQVHGRYRKAKKDSDNRASCVWIMLSLWAIGCALDALGAVPKGQGKGEKVAEQAQRLSQCDLNVELK